MSTANCRRSNNPASSPANDPPITMARPASSLISLSITSDGRSWFIVPCKVSSRTWPFDIMATTEEFHGLDHVRQAGGAERPDRMADRAAGRVRPRSLQPQWLRRQRAGFGNRQGPGMDHQAQAVTAVRLSPACAQLFLDRDHAMPWPPAPDGRLHG